jgi:hypothetical protein
MKHKEEKKHKKEKPSMHEKEHEKKMMKKGCK